MIQSGFQVKGAHVNVLGLTFKENCPDIRNSRVIDVMRELASFGVTVHVHDPIADPAEAMHEYGVTLTPWDELPRAHAIVAAVAHREYEQRPLDDLAAKMEPGGLYVDVKCQADTAALRARGIQVWRLVMPQPLRTSRLPWRAVSSSARTATALAGDRQRRVHRFPSARERCWSLGRTWSAWTISRPAIGAISTKCVQRSANRRGGGTASSKPISPTLRPAATHARASTSCCTRPHSAPSRDRSPIRCSPMPANATGFLNMLVAARDAGVARFVYAASSSTYGDHPGLPKVEDAIGRPLSPYAVTKYLDELYADVFGRCYGMATIGLRYFNVFGCPAGSGGSLRRGHSALGRHDAARLAGRHPRRRRNDARLLPCHQCRAGESAGGDRRAIPRRSTRSTTSR